MYVCHLNFIENLRILGPYYGNTINDRDLCFCMLARYMLKAKTVQYEVLNRLGSWFSRYPIFKVYTIMYNSAGKFSTNVETTIFETRFPTRFPYSIEQEASPPVQRKVALKMVSTFVENLPALLYMIMQTLKIGYLENLLPNGFETSYCTLFAFSTYLANIQKHKSLSFMVFP